MTTHTHSVYTDGACAPSNPGPCGWGAIVIHRESLLVTEHFGFIGHGTNQIAEITAAISGLLLVPAGTVVELVSDSMYVLKGLKEWRRGWERNGWRNAKKEPVANMALWKQLFAAADDRKVSVRWVKGHAGDKYNELADAMANKSLVTKSASAKSQPPTVAAPPSHVVDEPKRQIFHADSGFQNSLGDPEDIGVFEVNSFMVGRSIASVAFSPAPEDKYRGRMILTLDDGTLVHIHGQGTQDHNKCVNVYIDRAVPVLDIAPKVESIVPVVNRSSPRP